jgi:CRISPR-associated endonuclease/helicase Cas3
VNLIVNLSNIEDKYLSHPHCSYSKHINNVADSFNDKNHITSALFHDLGKLCSDFQAYIDPANPCKKKTIHSIIGAMIYLADNGYHLDKNTFPIFFSILKHHLNLEDVCAMAEEMNDNEFLLAKYPNLIDKIDEIKNIIRYNSNVDLEKCCDFFDSDYDNFVKINELNSIHEYFLIKDVFSKLIFADKYEAIFNHSFQEKYFENPEKYIAKLKNHLSKKTNDLSVIRNSARFDILKNFESNPNKRLFIIEAPTGIGKTFIALNLALEIVRRKNKKRIVTALPMTSIIDQTFLEYSKIFEEKKILKYHHLTKSKSRKLEELDEESKQDYKQKESFLTKSWAEDNVIITTFNQILNLFYSNRNRDLIKFWTLRDSVIIFDEIQAIPRILLRDFSQTVSFLSKHFNIDFILMSATIPEIKKFLDLEIVIELLDNKYFSMDFNNRYLLRYNNEIDSKERLIKAIENQFNKNKSVLAVVNSKKLAFNLFENFKNKYSENEIYLLSSYFIPKHRKNIITHVSKKLKEMKKIFLISTQVVEAGVDLDFDCGFREFSPLYSIIQTAGRINRENRNLVFDTACLTIFDEIGFSPYHQNDLLKSEVKELLSQDIRENKLLPLLKKYFKIAIDRTPSEVILQKEMINLNFEKVMKLFDANFMSKMPYLTQIFIEIEDGLYNYFYKKLDSLYDLLKNKDLPLKRKMKIKISINEIYKDIAQYVINVPKNEVCDFESFYCESDMKVCTYIDLDSCYNSQTGWHRTTTSHAPCIL